MSGKDNKEEQLLNIEFISVTLEISHLEIRQRKNQKLFCFHTIIYLYWKNNLWIIFDIFPDYKYYFTILGKIVNDLQLKNMHLMMVTFEVFHFEISDTDFNDFNY